MKKLFLFASILLCLSVTSLFAGSWLPSGSVLGQITEIECFDMEGTGWNIQVKFENDPTYWRTDLSTDCGNDQKTFDRLLAILMALKSNGSSVDKVWKKNAQLDHHFSGVLFK